MNEDQPTTEEESPPAFVFEGFEPANTTPVPDVLFDELLTVLSGTELKVLLYVIRRTLGFKKSSDGISLTQFTDGITTKDGRVLDKGCGIKKRSTVSKTLRDLIKKGCLESEKGKTDLGDDAVTVYRVHFKGVVAKSALPSAQTDTTVVPKQALPGSGQTDTRGSADSATHKKQITRNSKQETDRQEGTSPREQSDDSGSSEPTHALSSQDNSTLPAIKELSPVLDDAIERIDDARDALSQADSDGYEKTEQQNSAAPAKPASARRSRQPKAPKVLPEEIELYRRVFDDCYREALDDESVGYAHTKASDTCIKDLLEMNLSRPKFVTPRKLHAVYVRLWNMPKDPKTGFYWREHMSIKAVCKNYEAQALAMTAVAREKQLSQQVRTEEDIKREAAERAQSGELLGGMYRYIAPSSNPPMAYMTAEQREAVFGGK